MKEVFQVFQIFQGFTKEVKTALLCWTHFCTLRVCLSWSDRQQGSRVDSLRLLLESSKVKLFSADSRVWWLQARM